MATYLPPAPMPPPEIRDQQQQQQGQEGGGGQPPVMMQVGQSLNQGQQQGGGPNTLAMLEQKIQELERWAQDTMMLAEQVHKPLTAFLVPIAKAGMALKQQVEQMKQRQGQGGAGPAPKMNPAEGAQPPQQQAA